MGAPTLAILGGEPRFARPLHVGRPNIGDRARFLGLVEDALDRRWLSNDGKFVQELEAKLASYLGVRHCVVVSSGTMALGLAARALGLQREVIVPAFTFVATAHVLEWLGLTPVFCDIDPRTHCIDARAAESLITANTSGIVGVHLWGEPADVEALSQLAERRGVRLLFDAAHAFGVSHLGTMIGGFGDAEAFSFHATKVFNTFEGGAVATNDDRIADEVRRLRNFGFAGADVVQGPGINGKMHEISAAMGLANLESLEDFVACNERNYRAYESGLADVEGVRLLRHDSRDVRNYHYVVLELDEREGLISRDRLMEVLHAENVLARRYYWPGCHRVEPYLSQPRNAGLQLPVTDRVVRRVLVLPTGTEMTEDDVAVVCEVIRIAVRSSGRLI